MRALPIIWKRTRRYVESTHNSRQDRMADAAKTMGVTVVMGGITTLGAGLFMAFCVSAAPPPPCVCDGDCYTVCLHIIGHLETMHG